MQYNKKTIILINATIFFLIAISGLYAQSGIDPYKIERVGLTGWQFLKIQNDARFAAMGGAFTAVSRGDAGSIFSNPAALTGVTNLDCFISNVNWIADIGYRNASIAKRIGQVGVFGFSIAVVDMGEMAETINSPVIGENRTEAVVTGNTFSASDFAVGLSYAKKITDRLSIGGNVRWIQEKIADVSMQNVSVDFGTIFYTGFKSLRFAMLARNFGPDAHLVGWSEEYQSEAVDVRMPLDFRLGLAMDFFDTEGSNQLLTISLDGSHPNDGPEKINLGGEYIFADILILRAGYRFNYDEENFSFGGGLQHKIGQVSAKINYAFVNFSRLKQVQMFSLGFSF